MQLYDRHCIALVRCLNIFNDKVTAPVIVCCSKTECIGAVHLSGVLHTSCVSLTEASANILTSQPLLLYFHTLFLTEPLLT